MTHSAHEYAVASRARGISWADILSHLVGEGAKEVDLVRLVRDIEGVGVSQARETVYESGLFERQDFVMVVDEEDAWFAEVFGSGSDEIEASE